MKAKIDLMREWKKDELERGIRFSYPAPDRAKGFYPCGFVRSNDSAANLAGWYGLFLTVAGKDCEFPGKDPEKPRRPEQSESRQDSGIRTSVPIELYVEVSFAEEEPLGTRIPVLMHNRNAEVEIPFTVFPQELVKENRWEFVTAVEVQYSCDGLETVECTARRRPGLWFQMPEKGKAGDVGENIYYRGTVYNCASEPLAVTADQVFEGWESLIAQVVLGEDSRELGTKRNGSICGEQDAKGISSICGETDPSRILQPGEAVPITVFVSIHDYMVPGGHENTRIRVRGQGSRISSEDSVELKTMRRLPHPYLYHDTAGWKRTMENIKEYEPYRHEFTKLKETADAWTVTDPMEGKPFCYETKTETSIMSTAYLYALTGQQEYAEKAADFFRRFSDRGNGYPARKRGCSQSYVQEGHFFKHLAIAYDIIYDSDVLTREDRDAVEACFRLYMEMLDMHVRDGHISNWLLSELQGALFCALTLQDMDRALRFAFGNGGIVEQFRHGIFNDGWWHECSVGYNTWVSSIMLHTARALIPFGYDLVHARFAVPFNREVRSTYRGEAPVVQFGMYNQKWGGNLKSSVCIKDMFDAPLSFLDYRGVLFGIADSDEKKLSRVHFGSTYDLAYYYYHDPGYLPVIARNDIDVIFGEPKVHRLALEKEAWEAGKDSQEGSVGKPLENADNLQIQPLGNAHADNIGLALLRSQKVGRSRREQIQAVLRYGSHGYAHGHFDITDLLSVMRYGRSFFNPENCWWGYAHFMYKFYVQCSLTKNMVVVDEKMQNPADSKRILWKSSEGLQAAGVEVRTKWSYPPYGGMVYTQDGQTATKEELRKRCKMNGCFLPIVEGEGSPVYGELTGFTEPILQRRVMAVTDDYIVLFDYVKGEQEHCCDSLMQIKGFLGIEGPDVRQTRHTEQMNANPVSDAQFITDCNWYEVKGGSVARFRTVFTEEHAGERLVCDRSNYNAPGILNMDIHTAWPRETEQMVGRVAVYEGWAADGNGYTIPLSYRAEVDGKTKESGGFDGWILGRGEIDLDVKGASLVVLSLQQGAMRNEIGEPVRTPQGVFWGEICLELEDGTKLNLGQSLKKEQEVSGADQGSERETFVSWETQGTEELDESGEESEESAAGAGRTWEAERIRTENVDTSCGIGRDYKGGRVTIVGTEYPYALGASPLDHGQESRIILNLKGLPVTRLTACVGVDAFPGDEWQKRKTYAVRSHGSVNRFVTVVEPYEVESVIERVSAEGPDQVEVALKNGSVQEIFLTGMEEGCPDVELHVS